MRENGLAERLQAYAASDMYPFHMPGHKRRMALPTNAYQLDITEIDGFDNLHHAQGILKEEQQRYADMVGAQRTFFLVNGSSCGILAAISAAVPRGGKLLLARNSHKAAYHALEMCGLHAAYVYPAIAACDIQGAISPQEIAQALQKDPSIQAVYVTSPTYDGVVSDIEAIAQIAHQYGLPLIVDEAHGAHFGLHLSFPRSAVSCGADVVIQSVHKTLPAFTQSAVLHVCSARVLAERLEHFLAIYESSSPSYVLMAGMSRLMPFLNENGTALFSELRVQLDLFYEKTSILQHLHVITAQDFDAHTAFARDDSKILISTNASNINGKQLYERLLEEYRLQLEMYSGEYVTALCSLMDTAEGFARLAEALLEIDAQLERKVCRSQDSAKQADSGFVSRVYRKRETVCVLAQAMDARAAGQQAVRPLAQAVGTISAEYVYLYPPGIPLLVPGERIDAAFADDMKELLACGLLPEGMQDKTGVHIAVLNIQEH